MIESIFNQLGVPLFNPEWTEQEAATKPIQQQVAE